VFNEVNFDINNPNQQATVDLDSETEPEQIPSISEDTHPQHVRQSSRTKRQPVRFGFDEYVDVATVDHLACRAAQVLEPKTIGCNVKAIALSAFSLHIYRLTISMS